VSPSLPGLRFSLFGFSVTIGVDFFLITLIIGLQVRPGVQILEWIAVVALSILIHELGHAFALRAYSIHPEIRLWGMGGLTISGFVLPPRKSILVSLAGPLVGIPVAVAVMVVRPWLPAGDPFALVTGDLIFVNLWWGILNLLPIAGLDGGNVLTNLFVVIFGQRGRRPGLIVVALSSVAIAIGAIFVGFVYLTIVIAFFGFFNPEPYLMLWHTVSGRGGPQLAAGGPAKGSWAGDRADDRQKGRDDRTRGRDDRKTDKHGRDRQIVLVASESRRAFGELYGETMPGATAGAATSAATAATTGVGGATETPGLGSPAGPDADAIDLDELERRPAPLLPDVTGMIARRDDPAVAARLGGETDPLAVLGIVTRVVEGQRVAQLLGTLRRGSVPNRTAALLKLQVGLHVLGRFDDSLAAASILGASGGSRSAVLEARSAARKGDRKRAASALERVLSLGAVKLSDGALGDLVRLGPDRRVAELLNKLRAANNRG
jgi:Zn-dependent protease